MIERKIGLTFSELESFDLYKGLQTTYLYDIMRYRDVAAIKKISRYIACESISIRKSRKHDFRMASSENL